MGGNVTDDPDCEVYVFVKALEDLQKELRCYQSGLIQRLCKLVRSQAKASYRTKETNALVAKKLQQTLNMLDAKLALASKPEELLNIRHVSPKQSRLGTFQLWRSENGKVVGVASGAEFPIVNAVSTFESANSKELIERQNAA